MTEAYIYDALRTPRGKGRKDGSLHEVTALRLSTQTLNAVNARNTLDGHAVEDVIWGNVTQVMEQGGCLARSAVLASDLDDSIPGLAINRFCASGMEAVNLAANQIKGGAGQAYIAGGVEMMDADALAVESQRRAKAAWDDNRFKKSVITIRDINGLPILDHDEYMRPGTNMQSLGALNPSFQQMGEVMPGFDKIALMKYPHLEQINHIHHAGNSSGIVDGAAAVLIGNKAFGEKYGLTSRARIKATAKIGTDPTIMLTGPIQVTEKILKDNGMEISDIDLFEVNEAFASVVLLFMQAFDVEPDKINVNGGSIAMGHPLGATGAMIIGTLLDELERSGKETGLATLCIASGMGAATIIERV
ncbi:MAG: acetyl-CoA acetyltransferase [Rhodobacteraceae bacterium]|nr:acetyl-CoA acetyltransferase [Paracoccaceae bacterium]